MSNVSRLVRWSLVALWIYAGALGADPTDAPLAIHRIEVRIDPAAGTLAATDRLTLPPGRRDWDLILHRDLSPRVAAGDATLKALDRQGHLERLRLELGQGSDGTVTLAYGGTIRHGLAAESEGMGRERQSSLGTIGPEGVFLDGASGWYPGVPGSLQRFTLAVSLPAGWSAVSQGAGPGPDAADTGVWRWSEPQPQDAMYLVAAPFVPYRESRDGIEAQVWLRQPDPALAGRYLAATRNYLDLYGRLIGPYPYAKFALVENFWESGYGMPSFTLLGPQVIRLPFIVRTSYPHEILHNWWGNGVYIDDSGGNWSEGLTTYLADYLMKEQEGLGADYRRDSLKGYADYVSGGEDFPLAQFRGRHGDASQAVGYGKSAMFFHMLRRQLGDDAFRRGLQRFYADHRFRYARFDDLRRAFEQSGGADLAAFFAAWTGRAGAPRLALEDVRVAPRGADGFRVSGRIAQIQSAPPFPLLVPVVVHQERGEPATLQVALAGRQAEFSADLSSPPLRVAVDPAFDTFRDLAPGESPVALSRLFGAERGLMVLPAAADPALLAGYRALAESWLAGHPGWSLSADRDIATLPADRPVWLLGWENRFLSDFARDARGFALTPADRRLTIGGQPVESESASPVLTRERDGQPLGWLAAGDPAALPGLARKLPHYGKYGYLTFAGAVPDNRLKGQWAPGDSALVHWFGDRRPELKRLPEPALIAP